MLRRLTSGEFALAILVTSLFWIGVLVWATSYARSNPEKEACYQAAQKSGRSTEECKSLWEKTTSDPVAVFTLVLAVSTVGLWGATIGLYLAGERQLAHARSEAEAADFHRTAQYEQIAEQIEALRLSAAAAEDSVTETRRLVWNSEITAKRQLRAYIHVSEAKFADFGFPNGVYMVNYTNTGQTPAYDVYSSIAVHFGGFPLSEDLVAVGSGTKGVITLGRDGDGHARIEAPRGLSGEEYGAVRDGKSAVFVFGKISYRDVFGDNWTTEFRYYVGGDQGIRSDGFLASHSDGNKAT
jgi:hypothetical protein